MKMSARTTCRLVLTVALVIVSASLCGQNGVVDPQKSESPIRFELKTLPFRLDSDESQSRNAPETMAGGVAVFDYDGDGRPDIFFTNGADLATMKKPARSNGTGSITTTGTAPLPM
jgi:hypothetical protein